MARPKKPIRVRLQHALTEADEKITVEVMLSDGRWLIMGMTYDDFEDLHAAMARIMHEIAQRN